MSRSMQFIMIAVTLATGLSLSACSEKPPSRPVNHNPVISSATATPPEMGPGDSTVITVIATDQDGDTLVYDWDTDLRLRIKGNPPNYPVKTHTFNNAETFYPNYTPIDLDTVWVVCSTRDRIGGVASRVDYITLHP